MSAPKCFASLIKLIFVIGLSLLLISCNAGTSTSNPPTTVVQVQSIFPANGDTSVGVSNPIIVTFASPVESAGINATLMDLKNNLLADLTSTANADKTIYIFSPAKALNPSSTYRFTLLGDNTQSTSSSTLFSNPSQNNSSNILASSTYTTQTGYKIFVTGGEYKGNLRGSYLTASSGADAICNADSANPDKNQYYMAMLSVVGERYACSSENVCGGTNSLNWVLQPGTGYYNVNSELISTTNNQSIFIFPLAIAFGLGSSSNVWTGLSTTWGSVDGGDSCKAWTSSSSENKGRCGRSAQVDPGAISNDKQDCNGTRKVYCVMQPNAILTTPLAGSTTNDYAAPIKVMFNVVGGVNSSTVTTSSFTVTESSSGVSGHTITGTIASADNITYTFTPSSALVPGKVYSVHLSSSISSNNGVPIADTTQSFFTATETKLIYLTTDKWWGDLLEVAQKNGSTATTGVTGADFLCQQDPQCPAGKTCKAMISDALNRVACIDNPNDTESAVKLCGPGYSVDWVLTPTTTYVNTNGAVIGTTNANGIFNFLIGFQFSTPISSGGKAWTGLLPYWTSQKKITCERWTIGDSGVNRLGGMIGYADQINYNSIFAGANSAGGCSQYNKEDGFGGKYCYNEVEGKKVIEGCSKRSLYCAVQ